MNCVSKKSTILLLSALLLSFQVQPALSHKKTCVERVDLPGEWGIGKKAAFGAAVGIGSILLAPVALGAAGFGAAGVASGSIAAGLQGAAVTSGSWFATFQSVAAGGLAKSTIWATVSSSGLLGGLLPEMSDDNKELLLQIKKEVEEMENKPDYIDWNEAEVSEFFDDWGICRVSKLVASGELTGKLLYLMIKMDMIRDFVLPYPGERKTFSKVVVREL